MKNKISKKQLENFFCGMLNDMEEAEIKDILKNNKDSYYQKLESYRSIKLDNKASFFKQFDKVNAKKEAIYYISGIAASLLLLFSLTFFLKDNSINKVLANWDDYSAIEKLKFLDNIKINTSIDIESLQLIVLYKKEKNINVKLNIIDCLKIVDSKQINFEELLKNETAPMAQLGLTSLKNEMK